MSTKKQKRPLSSQEPFSTPFASLFQEHGLVSDPHTSASYSQERDVSPSPTERSIPLNYEQCQKVVVRLDRRGRAGKSLTWIEHLPFSEDECKELALRIKRALGCGAFVEYPKVAVQGDQLLRLQQWLLEQGVRQVILGSRPNSRK